MEDKNQLIRKFIPIVAIFSSLAPLFIMMFHMVDDGIDYVVHASIILAYIIGGTLLSFVLYHLNLRKNKNIINTNQKGDIYLIKQKTYLLALPVYVIGYFIGISSGAGYGIIFAISTGTAFLFGIGNGLFDYRDILTKNLLYAGVVPIGFSFVYAYYGTLAESPTDVAWFFGSMYLLAYLLFINRMNLNSILFFRNSINVENGKKIRLQNDLLIGVFYIVYLIIFNFRGLLNFSYEKILMAAFFILEVMAKIMDFLLVDATGEDIPQEENIMDFFRAEETSNWLTYVLFILLGIAFLAGAVFLIIALYRFIRMIVIKIKASSGITDKKAQKKKVVSKEYEEESEIIKDQKQIETKKKKKKFQYDLKHLNELQTTKEKIRYLYGFTIERLKDRKAEIRPSDSPEELLEKVAKYEGYDQLQDNGFSEFTNEYIKVRYGDKDSKFEINSEKAKQFEKSIHGIKVPEKEERKSNL